MIRHVICLLWLSTTSAFLTPIAWTIPRGPRPQMYRSRIQHDGFASQRLSLHLQERQGEDNQWMEPIPIASQAPTRRHFLHTLLLPPLSLLLPATSQAAYFSLTNNNNIPYTTQRTKQSKAAQQLADRQQKVSSVANAKKWIPFSNLSKWDSVETCLLEMLPVKNAVFRKLQECIEAISLDAIDPTDVESRKQITLDTLTALSLLESKRSNLEPVFNQEDPTALFISKSSIGERNLERLRNDLEEMVRICSGGELMDVTVMNLGSGISFIPVWKNEDGAPGTGVGVTSSSTAFSPIDMAAAQHQKKRILQSLAEVGELLVSSFPYAVPTRGKFAYLPRLLGRCTVTFTFERPLSTTSTLSFGLFNDNTSANQRILGNVTIVADGYAAPITAGNFVDLSLRNFYTGLSVKAMRKRLGVVPSWSDNVIVNDLTELKDNLDVMRDDFGSDLSLAEKRLGFFQSKDNNIGRGGEGISSLQQQQEMFGFDDQDNRMTMDAVLPILGSFQEGFYDPLTAKPRRIPLELVALDPSSPTKASLTYSSSFASIDVDATATGTTTTSVLTSSSSPQRSFSSATSEASTNSTTSASVGNLHPLLSFRIPNLVALNHPDRVSNGGSSEFFALPQRDISSKRTKLLDGQYAPFGYIVEGSEVYNSLRPGDVIKATYVSELGQLNLVKIRKNAFEGGEEVEEAGEEGGGGEKEG